MALKINDLWDALERGRRFVTHDVWHIGAPGEEVPNGLIIKHIRVAILLAKGLVRDDLLLRAAALTFATILSIVPFLVIMFYIIQTFGVGEFINEKTIGTLIPPLATRTVGPGPVIAPSPDTTGTETPPDPMSAVSDPATTPPAAATAVTDSADAQRAYDQALKMRLIDILFLGFKESAKQVSQTTTTDPVELIRQYAEQGVKPGNLTLASVLFVIVTVFGLMMNIENSFNAIWGTKRVRSWYRLCTDYLMILLFLPFLVAGVLSLTVAVQSSEISHKLGPFSVGLHGIQYMLCWGLFAALYYTVPNARVKFRYALTGGIIAGTLWSMVSLAYVRFQFSLPHWGLLYSAFAQVPVLLLWAFLSWLILLLGAELTFAYQNEKTFAMERLADGASPAYRETVGVLLMFEIARRFELGCSGLSADVFVRDWNVPTRLVNDSLLILEEAKLVVRTVTDPPTYQPGRSLTKITMDDVITCLREAGQEPSALRSSPVCESIFRAVRTTANQEESARSLLSLLSAYENACTHQLARNGADLNKNNVPTEPVA